MFWKPLLLVVLHNFLGVNGQTPTLGLADGFLSFNTTPFSLQLVKDSQTLYSLKPRNDSSFDFVPADMMSQRQYNGNVHLGDISFRARLLGASSWVSGDTYTSRKPVTPLPISGATLAASNLSPTLPSNTLLNITRRWVVQDETIQLLFDISNTQNNSVEIGALGASLELNNVGFVVQYSSIGSFSRNPRFSLDVRLRKRTNFAVCSTRISAKMLDTSKLRLS